MIVTRASRALALVPPTRRMNSTQTEMARRRRQRFYRTRIELTRVRARAKALCDIHGVTRARASAA